MKEYIEKLIIVYPDTRIYIEKIIFNSPDKTINESFIFMAVKDEHYDNKHFNTENELIDYLESLINKSKTIQWKTFKSKTPQYTFIDITM